MANAYATLARGGEFIEARLVRSIADDKGKVIKEFSQRREVVFDREPVAQLVDALQDVVEKGTGTRARLFDRPVAGKTGTSDAGKDIWFVGFTPDMVTAVWGGNDDNKAVRGTVTGGTVMAKIWHNYMSAFYRQHDVPAGQFPEPQYPLMEEPEPIHIWPSPSPVLQFFDGWWRQGPPPETNSVREYRWESRDAEKPGTERVSHTPKKKKNGLMRKLKDWFDF
jgi:membrane peptidoglycan carboxypeptidase